MVGPTFGGDPDDTGVAPVPLTILGVIVTLLSATIGGTAVVAIGLAGGGLSWTGLWITAAFVGFGLALIGWDQLTDSFEQDRPGSGWDGDDELEDESGLGTAVEPEAHSRRDT